MMLLIRYQHCASEWFDLWDSACDSECPECGQSIEAMEWGDVEGIWNDAVTLEEMRQNI